MTYKEYRVPTVFAGRTPRCTTQREYELWNVGAKQVNAIESKAGFCLDCTPEHQAIMCLADRCENPHVTFSVACDGSIHGMAPLRKTMLMIARGIKVNREPSSLLPNERKQKRRIRDHLRHIRLYKSARRRNKAQK